MTLLLLDLFLCAGVAAAFLAALHTYRGQLRASQRPVCLRARDRRG